ncbi:MAG: Mth938-like domain-containing protein [Gammaproteobacteria bacterium]|nr:Mth938-like domain-containing protein [Gammaproteobacteria bacterium]
MDNTVASESRKSVKITLDEDYSRFGIYAYHPGEITIIRPNDAYKSDDEGFGHQTLKKETLTNSLIIMPHCLMSDWAPRTINDLAEHHFEIFSPPPQILLLGTGSAHHWPSANILGSLSNQGIAVEVMNTAAACRTYAILASDGRNVGAALLIE